MKKVFNDVKNFIDVKINKFVIDELKLIESYINKYLVGKKIKFYPNCVVFFDYENNFIPCNTLSSGEKNVVLLFILAAVISYSFKKFDSKYNLILDEPDVSMNISWQESLIEDIKNIIGENVQLTVLTQSPQLIQNLELHDFVYDLLQRKIEF